MYLLLLIQSFYLFQPAGCEYKGNKLITLHSIIKTASSQNVHVHVLTLKRNNFHCQLRHKQKSFTEEIHSSCITDNFNWPYIIRNHLQKLRFGRYLVEVDTDYICTIFIKITVFGQQKEKPQK